VPVRLRRFFFSTEAKPNQVIVFETADEVISNGSVVIPAGLAVVASIEQSSDIKELGQAAKAQLRFRYLVLRDGKRLPLRGTVDVRGKGVNKALLIAGAVTIDSGLTGVTGLGFAIPAATLFRAEVAGQQSLVVGGAGVLLDRTTAQPVKKRLSWTCSGQRLTWATTVPSGAQSLSRQCQTFVRDFDRLNGSIVC